MIDERLHALDASATLDALMANSPVGMAFFDAEYRYVRINQSLAQMNGLSVDDHIGRTVEDVLGDTAAIISPILAQVFATGKPVTDLELTGSTPAQPGIQRIWLNSFFPVFIADALCCVGVFVTEITDRKQVGVELRETEARFRNTFENAAVGIAHVGIDGQWLRVNQRLCDIVGYPRDELMRTNFQSITHPDDLEADLVLFEQLLNGEVDSYQIEKRYFHKNGNPIWIHLTTAMEWDKDKKPRYCISVVQDISNRKMAEMRLSTLASANAVLAASLDYQETLQRISEIMVEELADWCAIHILQPDGEIAQVALSSSDPAKTQWVKGLHDSQSPNLGLQQGVPSVIRTGEALFFPEISDELLQQSTTDAQKLAMLRGLDLTSAMIVPLQTRGSAIGALTLVTAESGRRYTEGDFDFAGELAQRAAIAVDNAQLVTSLKHAEANLRAANEGLEKRIEERTQDLERSNRELQEFAYVASHDLQEPLRKIIAFGDRLQTKYAVDLDETGGDYIRRMQGAAMRMQRLINDLLSLSCVTTSGQPFEPVDLNMTLQDVVEDLETLIETTNALVIVGSLPVIEGDPSQMYQLFQNLIANGLKFQRYDASPRVEISSVESDRPQESGLCHISVADNGIGFDNTYLDRIFQPFQRLHGRQTYEGTGMGLAICRRIVERHGGAIEGTGVLGQGAVFTVTLPIASSSHETPSA